MVSGSSIQSNLCGRSRISDRHTGRSSGFLGGKGLINMAARTPTMLSSTPAYPPPDNYTVHWPGSQHSLAPSPFLGPGQYSTRLPPPESPTPSMMFTPPSSHSHNISISSITSNYLDVDVKQERPYIKEGQPHTEDERPHVKNERP